jgi:hypothetical protein
MDVLWFMHNYRSASQKQHKNIPIYLNSSKSFAIHHTMFSISFFFCMQTEEKCLQIVQSSVVWIANRRSIIPQMPFSFFFSFFSPSTMKREKAKKKKVLLRFLSRCHSQNRISFRLTWVATPRFLAFLSLEEKKTFHLDVVKGQGCDDLRQMWQITRHDAARASSLVRSE